MQYPPGLQPSPYFQPPPPQQYAPPPQQYAPQPQQYAPQPQQYSSQYPQQYSQQYSQQPQQYPSPQSPFQDGYPGQQAAQQDKKKSSNLAFAGWSLLVLVLLFLVWYLFVRIDIKLGDIVKYNFPGGSNIPLENNGESSYCADTAKDDITIYGKVANIGEDGMLVVIPSIIETTGPTVTGRCNVATGQIAWSRNSQTTISQGPVYIKTHFGSMDDKSYILPTSTQLKVALLKVPKNKVTKLTELPTLEQLSKAAADKADAAAKDKTA